MKNGNARRSLVKPFHSVVFVGVLSIVAVVVAVPVYSVRSAPTGLSQVSGASEKVSRVGSIADLNRTFSAPSFSRLRSLLPIPQSAQETIATFAADCATPRATFFLGETVCAKTDSVDLNYPGGRWVDWILTGTTNTIVSGSRTTTLITTNPQTFTYAPTVAGVYKVEITQDLNGQDDPQTPAVFTVTAQTAPIATYEANCIIPKTTFNLGDTVCAKAMGITPGFGRRFAWTDPAGFVRTLTDLTTDPQTDSYPLPGTQTSVIGTTTVDNRGAWKVSIISSRGSTLVATPFDVKGATASVDLAISKGLASSNVDSGANFSFIVSVSNSGPDDAANVVVTDVTPLNATFQSATQTSGSPAFSCNGTSTVTCNGATLAAGARVIFEFVYTAGAAGTTVTNTATVSSDTAEINSNDNSSTAEFRIGNGGTATSCVIECPNNMTVSANTSQNNQPGAYVTYSPEPFGSCGAITNNPASGSFFPVGTTQVSSTSATGGGACSFTITVIQSAPPTISCPSDISVVANSGQSTAYVPDPNGTSSDPGTPTVTGSGVTYVGERSDQEPLGNAYPVGVTTIFWTATDNGGRTATCKQKITVTSPDAPTISCPSDKTFAAASGECTYTATAAQIGTPTTTGPNVTVTNERSDSQALTDPYPAGQTFITWTATNNVSSASCTQKITVQATDNQPPTLNVPPDVNATTDHCTALLDDELGVATASDNCTASVNITRTGVPRVACPAPGDPGRTCESFDFPTGTTIITYTATDAAGNSTTGTQRVTVSEDPVVRPTFTFVPGDLTVYTGPGATTCSTFVGDATLGTATATDNCPGVTVSRSGVPAGNIFPLGDTYITYTATDRAGNTNATEAKQKVTVVDNTPPVISCPANITHNTDPGSCSATVNPGTATATDNCDNSPTINGTRSDNQPLNAPYPKGTTTITWTATDHASPTPNQSSCTQTIKVEDHEAPTISCPGNIMKNNDPGICGAVVTYATPVGSDNCPGATTAQTAGLPSGSTFPVGTTTNTFEVTDTSGNKTSCSFMVTVNDVEDPVISCPSSQTLEPTCPSGAVATWTPPVGTDNCPGAVTTRSGPAPGSVFPIGMTTTVAYTVNDAHGHSASCNFTVTVKTVNQTIEDLKTSITNSSLSPTNKGGLLSKLQAAQDALAIGHTNTACSKLDAFNNSVQNLIDHGNISASQGQSWINSSNHVRNTIGCTNNPCT